MKDTKLTLFTWLLWLYYVKTSKPGISSHTTRLMFRKIRFSIEESNGNFKLDNTIEFYGTYAGCPSKNYTRGLS